jgi:hypothetical protein
MAAKDGMKRRWRGLFATTLARRHPMAKDGTLAKSCDLQPSFQTTPVKISIGIDLGDCFSHWI